MNKCAVCQNLDTKIVFTEFSIDILKCKNCGHVFSSYGSNEDYGGYYGEKIESSGQFWWDKAHERMYNDFCKRFIADKRGILLDVGCGLGYFVKKISSFPDWRAFGYEISKPAVEFARNKLSLKNVYSGKVEESDFQENCFDIITLWDVIEHIPNPHSVLSYLALILKDDGFLFIHTPNIKIQLFKAKVKKIVKGMNSNTHYLEAKDHINNYSVKTIKTVLRGNGFRNVEFIHLYPIQSVSGSKNIILKFIKNLWFYAAKFLSLITFGKINIDNLFVIAKK